MNTVDETTTTHSSMVEIVSFTNTSKILIAITIRQFRRLMPSEAMLVLLLSLEWWRPSHAVERVGVEDREK